MGISVKGAYIYTAIYCFVLYVFFYFIIYSSTNLPLFRFFLTIVFITILPMKASMIYGFATVITAFVYFFYFAHFFLCEIFISEKDENLMLEKKNKENIITFFKLHTRQAIKTQNSSDDRYLCATAGATEPQSTIQTYYAACLIYS